MKMSVHQALSELKTYNARITRASQEVFITTSIANSDKVGGVDRKDAISRMEGNLKSATALIENRKRLKAAIVASNATTKVTIGGKEYTIAEAVERKALITHEQDLLKRMQLQYKNAVDYVNSTNELLPAKAEKYVASVTANDKSNRTNEDIKAMTEDYIKRNTLELVDPNNLKEQIDALTKSIEDFLTEVDYKLSESNATTIIEVDID